MCSVHVSVADLMTRGLTEAAKRYVLQALLVLNKGFNKGVGLSVEQIAMTIELLMEDPLLPNMKLDDMKLFVAKAIRGEYGECYGGLDPNTVLVWLRRYMKERMVAAERIRQKEKNIEDGKPVCRDAAWYQAVRDLDNHIKAWRKIARNGNGNLNENGNKARS